jgi:hypothetical protein
LGNRCQSFDRRTRLLCECITFNITFNIAKHITFDITFNIAKHITFDITDRVTFDIADCDSKCLHIRSEAESDRLCMLFTEDCKN